VADTQTSALGGVAEGLVSDVGRLLGQHLGRLKEEVVDELGKVTAAGASFGGGAGAAALGTVLGGLAVVHLAYKVTGLPLWLCYAGGSAAACAVGAGMFSQGMRQASEIEFVPEGTGRAVREVASRAADHAVS